MQCISLQEENLGLMTQKVLLRPTNLECFPTLNVQFCAFLKDPISNASLVFNEKPSGPYFLPENERNKQNLYQARFQFTHKSITDTSVLENYWLFELVLTITAVPQLHTAIY